MRYKTNEASPVQTKSLRADELGYWVERVHQLPDVRIAEVMAMRDAMRRNRYPGKQVLEETIDRLCDDIALLCRSESEDILQVQSGTDPDAT